MSVFPSIYDRDDPFNVWMRFAAPISILIVVPLVILLQQFNVSLHSATTSDPMADIAASEEAHEPGVGELVLSAKSVVKRVYADLAEQDPSGHAPARPFGDPDNPGVESGFATLDADSA